MFASAAEECLKDGVHVAGAVMTWEGGCMDEVHILASSEEDNPNCAGPSMSKVTRGSATITDGGFWSVTAVHYSDMRPGRSG